MLRLLGSVLIAYGLVGAVLLVAIGASVARPFDDLAQAGSSIGEQQEAALDALDRASETLDQTASSVRNMETSLVEARVATQRAATISRGVGQSMLGLAQQMQLTIFGVQPLIGLAGGFEQSGSQLELLGDDIDTIATALDANREDAVEVAAGLNELSRSIDRLREAVAAGPDVSAAIDALAPLQLALLALLGWLLVAAIGSIIAGLLCWRASRFAGRGSIDPTA